MQKIDISLQPSRYFICVLVMIWGLSNGILFFVPLYIPIKIFLYVATFIYAYKIFQRYGILQHSRSITSLTLMGKRWYVNQQAAQLLGDSTVTRYIAILCFKTLHSKKLLIGIILPDSPIDISYRRLVMWLRTVDILAYEKRSS